MQRVEDWDYDFQPLPDGALPTELFATERTLKLNDATMALNYYGPAHTDSDISVRFVEADVLHAADTYWNGVYPFIDYSTGGSIDGSIRAAEANLAATTDNTIVIPGHGPPVSDRAGLQAFRDMLVAVRENVARLKAQGRRSTRPWRRGRPRPSTPGGGSSSSRRPCSRGWSTRASEDARGPLTAARSLSWESSRARSPSSPAATAASAWRPPGASSPRAPTSSSRAGARPSSTRPWPDRRQRPGRARRRLQPRRPRPPLPDGPGREGADRRPVRERGPRRVPAARADHRGALRQDLRGQRQGHAVHGPEGPAADAGRGLDHPHRLHRRQPGDRRASASTRPPRRRSAISPAAGSWT